VCQLPFRNTQAVGDCNGGHVWASACRSRIVCLCSTAHTAACGALKVAVDTSLILSGMYCPLSIRPVLTSTPAFAVLCWCRSLCCLQPCTWLLWGSLMRGECRARLSHLAGQLFRQLYSCLSTSPSWCAYGGKAAAAATVYTAASSISF
jgi:hypothetical protein